MLERLCLGRKRILIKFEGQKLEGDQNLPGWLTIEETPELEEEDDFDQDEYESYFID